jgi:hypothetical protein
MAFGQIDPARLQGDALTQWYLRSPDDIEQERQEAASERYRAFFGGGIDPGIGLQPSAQPTDPEVSSALPGPGGDADAGLSLVPAGPNRWRTVRASSDQFALPAQGIAAQAPISATTGRTPDTAFINQNRTPSGRLQHQPQFAPPATRPVYRRFLCRCLCCRCFGVVLQTPAELPATSGGRSIRSARCRSGRIAASAFNNPPRTRRRPVMLARATGGHGVTATKAR